MTRHDALSLGQSRSYLAHPTILCGLMCRQAAVWGLVKALARPALHALTLGFQHPASGQQMDFQAGLPADFLHCLEGLRALDT